ncbi:hypothetical protein EYF80_027818 [Liparis tanakae]|uniref:Uncharacterized protein n=1 Tax=Liparis tanakae TaxID=230148 RepID=A0A4Z2HAE3_9TELE|nr:hypothetical protein EYF80_027818 [Liparis tanakae]
MPQVRHSSRGLKFTCSEVHMRGPNSGLANAWAANLACVLPRRPAEMVCEDGAGLEKKKLRDEVFLILHLLSFSRGRSLPLPCVRVSDGAPDSLAASHSWLLILISWEAEPVGGGYGDQLGGGERDDDFQVVTTRRVHLSTSFPKMSCGWCDRLRSHVI